jgi:hypothetical protein
LFEEELDMNHCTKSILTVALGLGLQSVAFAQAPSESAKPKPSTSAAHTSKAENHAPHVAKPEHTVKASQPMAAGGKSASAKPAADKVMPQKSTAKSVNKTKKVSKPAASK